MDKKKVIVHINNVSKILGTKRQTLSAGTLQHIQDELNLALSELNKPDWASVKDELPSYGEEVLTKSKEGYYIVTFRRKTYKGEVNHDIMDNNGFILPFTLSWDKITHWHKIDKEV